MRIDINSNNRVCKIYIIITNQPMHDEHGLVSTLSIFQKYLWLILIHYESLILIHE